MVTKGPDIDIFDPTLSWVIWIFYNIDIANMDVPGIL